jgi:hypothetical protein
MLRADHDDRGPVRGVASEPRRTSAMHCSGLKVSLLLLAALSPLLGGCSGYFLASSKQGFEATELKRAAFDLQCPVDHVVVTELVSGAVPVTPEEAGKGGDGTVIGVSGCGRQATYKFVQAAGWVVQTAAQK